MIDPGAILDSFVAMIATVPELSALTIAAHHGIYPDDRTFDEAIRQLEPGTMLFAWEGTSQGASQNRGAIWEHSFRGAVKAVETLDGMRYSTIWKGFIDGIPHGSTQPVIWAAFHEGCHPITPPSIIRTFVLVDQITGAGLEYFEIRFTVTEK